MEDRPFSRVARIPELSAAALASKRMVPKPGTLVKPSVPLTVELRRRRVSTPLTARLVIARPEGVTRRVSAPVPPVTVLLVARVAATSRVLAPVAPDRS